MKFEQLLQIYWSRGFLYGGSLKPFNLTLTEFFYELKGFNNKAKKLFIKRFDFTIFLYKKNKTFNMLPLDQRKIINMYISQIMNINNSIIELHRYNVLRLYLIKTFRGRAQAMGKPCHGQRTWSNAWTAHKNNKLLKTFITEVKKTSNVQQKTESKNQKFLKKKVKKPVIKLKIKEDKKTNAWF